MYEMSLPVVHPRYRMVRVPGSIPDRELLRTAQQIPKSPDARDYDRKPTRTAGEVVEGLGLPYGQVSDWVGFLEKQVVGASDKLMFTKSVLFKIMGDGLEDKRGVILERSGDFWNEYHRRLQKFHIGVDGDNELRKAVERGGKYYRRVPRSGGGFTYYYDKDKYHGRKDAHTNGVEAQDGYATGKVLQVVGNKGCKIDAFSGLVKKYGAEKVNEILKRAIKNQELTYEKGVFQKAKK